MVPLEELPRRYVERALDSDAWWVSGHTDDLDALVNVLWLAQEEPELLRNLLSHWAVGFTVSDDRVVAVVRGRNDREKVLTFSIAKYAAGWRVLGLKIPAALRERVLTSRQSLREEWRAQSATMLDSTEVAFALIQRQLRATERGDFFGIASLATDVDPVKTLAQFRAESPLFFNALVQWDTTAVRFLADTTPDFFRVVLDLPEKYASYPPDAYVYYDFARVGGVWLMASGPAPGYHLKW